MQITANRTLPAEISIPQQATVYVSMEGKGHMRKRPTGGAGGAGDPRTGDIGVNRDAASNGSAHSGSGTGPPKLYHTLTACTRCRSVRDLLQNLSLS